MLSSPLYSLVYSCCFLLIVASVSSEFRSSDLWSNEMIIHHRSDLHNTFLVTGECDVGFPRLPANFGGSLLNPGIQIIAEGPTFNDSAHVTALHLGGACPPGNCSGEFQIWRRSGSVFSLLHSYSVTLQPSGPTYFTTSVPVTGTVLPVEPSDVVGFSAPNNDANSPGINLATTTTSDTRYTLYEFSNTGPRTTLQINPNMTTRPQVVPLVSVEGEFILHTLYFELLYIT